MMEYRGQRRLGLSPGATQGGGGGSVGDSAASRETCFGHAAQYFIGAHGRRRLPRKGMAHTCNPASPCEGRLPQGARYDLRAHDGIESLHGPITTSPSSETPPYHLGIGQSFPIKELAPSPTPQGLLFARARPWGRQKPRTSLERGIRLRASRRSSKENQSHPGGDGKKQRRPPVLTVSERATVRITFRAPLVHWDPRHVHLHPALGEGSVAITKPTGDGGRLSSLASSRTSSKRYARLKETINIIWATVCRGHRPQPAGAFPVVGFLGSWPTRPILARRTSRSIPLLEVGTPEKCPELPSLGHASVSARSRRHTADSATSKYQTPTDGHPRSSPFAEDTGRWGLYNRRG